MKSVFKKAIPVLLALALLVNMNIFTSVFAASSIGTWTVTLNKECKGVAEIDPNNASSGKYSIKAQNFTPTAPNVYMMLSTKVNVEAGKQYRVGGKFKSLNSSNPTFTVDWGTRQKLTVFGSTYDWINFEYIYVAPENKEATLQIIMDGTTDGLWLDDMMFIDIETGSNLIDDPGFEELGRSMFGANDSGIIIEDIISDDNSTVNPELEKKFYEVSSGETFSVDDFMNTLGAQKFIPVYSAAGINIDGDFADWDKYTPIKIPTTSEQYQLYSSDGKFKDVDAVFKFAYDSESLYWFIEVEDDIHNHFIDSASYWQGDSIQFAISTGYDQTYGVSGGITYDKNLNKACLFSGAIPGEVLSRIQTAAKVVENKIYYEIAMPWTCTFDAKPERFLFNAIVNDNDGDGRRYCVEMSKGISEGKYNTYFPQFETMAEGKDWFAYTINRQQTALTGEECGYDFIVVNTSEVEKTFDVVIDGTEEKLIVPAQTGVHKILKKSFENSGEGRISIDVSAENHKTHLENSVTVGIAPATAEYTKGVIKKVGKYVAEIKALLDKCEKAGMETPYELAYYKILERYPTYLEEDIANNDLGRVYYCEEALTNIYSDAKEALEAYLTGARKPLQVDTYKTSPMKIDGQTVYAEVLTEDGSVEEKPVFFTGYGHFSSARRDIPNFPDFGMNSIQLEEGIRQCVNLNPSIVENWIKADGKTPSYDISLDTSVKHSGNASLRLKYKDALIANTFFKIKQSVRVIPGETYELKGWIKAENAPKITICPDDYRTRNNVGGDYDWKEVSFTWTAPEDTYATSIAILVEDKTGGNVYFDDFSFGLEGTDENLLVNGGFEETATKEYVFDCATTEMNELWKNLQLAEENNMNVSFLTATHYMPKAYIDKYEMGCKAAQFFTYNVNHPAARAITEDYLKFIIPKIADYDCVHNICISNEPLFKPEDCGDFYANDWHKYLSEYFGGDINRLNESYKTNYSSFDEVDFEYAGNPAKKYNYKQFNDTLFSDYHRFMAETCKKLAPNIPIQAKVMSYMRGTLLNNLQRLGGTGYEKYIEFCDLNGCDGYDCLTGKSDANGIEYPLQKQMWYEYMTSLKDAPVLNTEDHVIYRTAEYDVNNLDDVYVARDMYVSAVHGKVESDIWLWDRKNDPASDFYGSLLYRPAHLAKISKAALDLMRNADEISALQKEKRDVGILHSEMDFINNDSNSPVWYQAYASAMFNGKRVQFITDYQLEKMNDVKVLVVPHAIYASDRVMVALKDYVANGGNLVIFGKDCLQFNERNLPNDKALIDYIFANAIVLDYEGSSKGMDTYTPQEFSKIMREIYDEAGISYIKLYDAETNERVFNVDYNIGVCDGDVIINLCNYNEPMKVKVYLGDKLVEKSLDLVEMKEFGDTVDIKKYVPVTLQIKHDNVLFDSYGHWAEKHIAKLSNKGIIKGVSESRFEPQRDITRAEFLTLLMRASGFATSVYKDGIGDVFAGDWYARTVQTALDNGIIDSGVFRPLDAITREEMCEMLVRSYKHFNKGSLDRKELRFTDIEQISNIDSVTVAVSAGLMTGNDDGTFAPKGLATRAEAATVIDRYLDL